MIPPRPIGIRLDTDASPVTHASCCGLACTVLARYRMAALIARTLSSVGRRPGSRLSAHWNPRRGCDRRLSPE